MKLDVLIVGGGIAGLWLLAELRARNYSVCLVSDELGAGQTIASQGIIHGGAKYALVGKLTSASLAIGEMPSLWRNALKGIGNVNLHDVNVLAEHQYLWTSNSIGSKMTGFFASHTMKSKMESLSIHDYPKVFQHANFKGSLYQLDEPVLDMSSLLESFRKQYSDFLLEVDIKKSKIFKLDQSFQSNTKKYAYQAVLKNGESLCIEPQTIVVTAGQGNSALTELMGKESPVMQLRPLQMIMIRGKLPTLYAHALGMSEKPRATIGTYSYSEDDSIWYVGGQPAEQGVGQQSSELIKFTRQELQALLPWIDFNNLYWSTWNVNRAEGLQINGSRPDRPVIYKNHNIITAWPTKLAFAPLLASEVIELLPSSSNIIYKCTLSKPTVAKKLWNLVKWEKQ